MIPLVDDYLSELIKSRLSQLKSTPQLVDSILGASQSVVDGIKQYVSSRDIPVIKGYPRPPAQLPCIVLMLADEGEEQSGLGDYAEDDEDVEVRTYTEEVEVRVSPDIPVPYIQTTYKPLSSVSQIVHVELNVLFDSDTYVIQSPDLGIVGLYNGDVLEGDYLSVTYTYAATATVSLETLYESNYRIEVWTENGDLTAQLYALVKWAMLSGRGDLVSKGLIRQRLGGGDFAPIPEMKPAFVYRRALTFWCQFIASVPETQVGYFTGVEVIDHIVTDTTSI